MEASRSRAETAELLVQALQAGDGHQTALQLFELYYRPTQGFFLRRGSSRDEANDLAQETFVRVFRSIAGFRQEVPFEKWLFQIAANVWRNELRRRGAGKRRASPSLTSGPGELGRLPDRAGRDPLTRMLHREERDILEQAITALPPQMGKCFLLRVAEELDYDEIALVMNISAATARVHVHQARRRLRELLARPARDISSGR